MNAWSVARLPDGVCSSSRLGRHSGHWWLVSSGLSVDAVERSRVQLLWLTAQVAGQRTPSPSASSSLSCRAAAWVEGSLQPPSASSCAFDYELRLEGQFTSEEAHFERFRTLTTGAKEEQLRATVNQDTASDQACLANLHRTNAAGFPARPRGSEWWGSDHTRVLTVLLSRA